MFAAPAEKTPVKIIDIGDRLLPFGGVNEKFSVDIIIEMYDCLTTQIEENLDVIEHVTIFQKFKNAVAESINGYKQCEKYDDESDSIV